MYRGHQRPFSYLKDFYIVHLSLRLRSSKWLQKPLFCTEFCTSVQNVRTKHHEKKIIFIALASFENSFSKMFGMKMSVLEISNFVVRKCTKWPDIPLKTYLLFVRLDNDNIRHWSVSSQCLFYNYTIIGLIINYVNTFIVDFSQIYERYYF